jgi:hypothetical protein
LINGGIDISITVDDDDNGGVVVMEVALRLLVPMLDMGTVVGDWVRKRKLSMQHPASPEATRSQKPRIEIRLARVFCACLLLEDGLYLL